MVLVVSPGAKSRRPDAAKSTRPTWKDYVDQYVAPYIPIIRISERDPHFHKIVRTGVNTPSERPFYNDWWVATNAWTTWKDLWMRLEGYYSNEISDPRTR